jgi:hypothetical protein
MLLESVPAEGETVARDTDFRVRFDRRLSPSTVHRGTVFVRSGPETRFLSVRFDPVRSEIVATDFGTGVLQPNVEYELEVDGVRDLDGHEVSPVLIRFFTEDRLDPPSIRPVSFARVTEIFAAHCTACHWAERADAGLDLASVDGIERTALGVPARQTGGTEHTAVRGLGGMDIVDVVAGGGRPSTSYLIYKMLDDEHILGEVMPPAGALPLADVEAIADWIAGGAPRTEP